jgi:hypothetical protein
MAKEVPKFGEREVLQFIGVSELDPEEQETVNRLSTEYFEKVKRDVKNLTNVTVHVKVYGAEEENKRAKKYALHVKVYCPSQQFESCKSHGFELAKALHQAFDDVRTQIRHAFHTDVSMGKPYK